MSDWINTPPDKTIKDSAAFVYMIVNKLNNKRYIGYKTYWQTAKLPALKINTKKEDERLERYRKNLILAKKNRPINNRVSDKEKELIQKIKDYKKSIKSRISDKKGVRRHVKRQSDWLEYWSSCEELKADVEKYGEHNFDRIILSSHKTKMEAQYTEAKLQFEHEVIFTDKFYNGQIRCRFSKFMMTNLKK